MAFSMFAFRVFCHSPHLKQVDSCFTYYCLVQYLSVPQRLTQSASYKSGNSRPCRHFLGFVTQGKAFVVDESATSEGLIDQVFLFLVWVYPEFYTFLHHPCLSFCRCEVFWFSIVRTFRLYFGHHTTWHLQE